MNQSTITGIYAVPLFSRVWPGCESINAQLAELIRAKAPTDPDRGWSNVGGWHSPADVQSWESPAVGTLIGWIKAAVHEMTIATSGAPEFDGDFTLWVWANLLRTGGYNMIHDHPRAGWSGVYYVEPGEVSPGNPLAGQIEFVDPRVAVGSHELPGKPFDTPVRIKPQAGQMLLFPGWFKHLVHPYEGQSDRISIAFNLLYVPSGKK